MTRLEALPDSPRLKALWASGRIATPGLAATIVVALASTYLSDHYRAPPVIFALLLGMALNTLSAEPRYRPGIDLSARVLLRISVALLGLRITFAQVGQLGWSTAAMVLVTVPATIGFGMLMARALKLDSRFGVLSGGAVGICGASAAMAIAVAWPRKDTERDTVVVIACITTYSTIAMILYPALLGHLTLDATQTGRILGGSIHDVAQVIAAGYASSQRAGDAATIVKLMRVAMLLPVVLTITVKTAERLKIAAAADKTAFGKVALIPGFLVAFVVLTALNGFSLVPPSLAAALADVSKWLLVVAVAALGMKTNARDLVAVGRAALVLIAAETLFLGLAVVGWVTLSG
jgi:uncharacterized integral membrane protein (TIGR00698 family)